MPNTMTKKNVNQISIEKNDDLSNLKENEKEHDLTVFNRSINSLRQNDISTISQLKSLYDTLGEEKSIEKLTEIKYFGKKMAENIITKAVCYNYPKGYIPKAIPLPEWIINEDNNDEHSDDANKISVKEKEEDNIIKPIKLDEIENINININDYKSNLIDESELPGILLDIIFNLFEEGTPYNPERINSSYNYEQSDIFYNDKIILIQKEFIMDIFNKKCRNLKTIHNESLTNMFHIAVKNLSCVYKIFNKRDGHYFYWGRKPNSLGKNNILNYIEINRMEAEAIMNRNFNIFNDSNLNQTMIDLGFNSIEKKEKVIEKKDFNSTGKPSDFAYLIPVSNDGSMFRFNVVLIEDKSNFDINECTTKSGIYDIKNNELLLSKGLDYDLILKLVGKFL